jgi:hypothetical protein
MAEPKLQEFSNAICHPAASRSRAAELTLLSSQPRLAVIKTTNLTHINSYPMLALERAMTERGVTPRSLPQSPNVAAIAKYVSKLRLMANLYRSSAGPIFVPLMGFSEAKVFPFCYSDEIIPYCFDCWSHLYWRWKGFFRRLRVRVAFFSARQSAEYFSRELPKMKSVWLPEAADPDEYCGSKLLAERDIDVLELGRKYDEFHNRIREPIQQSGRVHLYERVKGQVVFPDKDSLVDGLGRSKISVCFPSSLTHPQRSGTVETVTLRYFEAMAARCVIFGHCPPELNSLFGYNPVVETEPGKEVSQIQFILANLAHFQELVDANYRRMLEVGTWKTRVETILHECSDIS